MDLGVALFQESTNWNFNVTWIHLFNQDFCNVQTWTSKKLRVSSANKWIFRKKHWILTSKTGDWQWWTRLEATNKRSCESKMGFEPIVDEPAEWRLNQLSSISWKKNLIFITLNKSTSQQNWGSKPPNIPSRGEKMTTPGPPGLWRCLV